MDRVEILYDLSEYVQMKPQRFGSNLLGVLYNNFSKKGARNLGANSRNPGANYDDVQFFFCHFFLLRRRVQVRITPISVI